MPTEIITLTDPNTGCLARIAPQLGFNCFQFRPVLQGREIEVLWSDPLFTEGTQRPSRSGIPLLFPFPGRIRGGKFAYRGKEYELDSSDGRGNAIHGFVYTRAWRVIAQTATSVTGEFQASLDDPTVLARWPSDFRIRATYTLSKEQSLDCSLEITNTGSTTLPWGLGAHPYFRVPLAGGGAKDCVIKIPLRERWELTDLLPTGRVLEVEDSESYRRGVPFEGMEFDDVLTDLEFVGDRWTGEVMDQAAGISTKIHFGREFPDCVVFTPPHREAVCIEPYTCAPNVYELRERGIETGLQELAPGESKTLSFTIGAAVI